MVWGQVLERAGVLLKETMLLPPQEILDAGLVIPEVGELGNSQRARSAKGSVAFAAMGGWLKCVTRHTPGTVWTYTPPYYQALVHSPSGIHEGGMHEGNTRGNA